MDIQHAKSGAITLWCFGPIGLKKRIAEIQRGFRWARTVIIADSRVPGWRPRGYATAMNIGESMGEYNGCLGYPSQYRGVTADEARLMGTQLNVRKKSNRHLRFTERNRMKYVIKPTEPLAFCSGGIRIAESDVRCFLEEMVSDGPVVLLLDDAGTVPDVRGGTSEISAKRRLPRWAEGYTVDLKSASRLRGLLPLPYWVPVTIVS